MQQRRDSCTRIEFTRTAEQVHSNVSGQWYNSTRTARQGYSSTSTARQRYVRAEAVSHCAAVDTATDNSTRVVHGA